MAYEGKRSAGTKKKSKWLVAIGVLLLLAAVGLIGFFAFGNEPQKVENPGYEEEREDDVIQTPFGALSYPGMWTDKVAHEITREDDDYSITFRSIIEGAETELFTLCYGSVPEMAYVMGSYGEIPVSVVMNAIEPEEDWSEQTLNQVYALQESVNDLLVQLREDAAFAPAQ